jgi:hypothetical protein
MAVSELVLARKRISREFPGWKFSSGFVEARITAKGILNLNFYSELNRAVRRQSERIGQRAGIPRHPAEEIALPARQSVRRSVLANRRMR